MKTVHGYSFTDQKWLAESQWPFLPKAGNSMSSLVTGNAVHLIGGCSMIEGVTHENFSALTMPLDRLRPVGEWQSGVFPDTPAGVGAINVSDCFVVCGGGQRGTVVRSVSFLDFEKGELLSLPNLSQPRVYPSVVHFQNSLIVFGGKNKSGFWSTTELLPAILPTT